LSVLATLVVLTLLLVFLFGSATEVGRGVAAVCRSPGCLRYSHWLRASVSRSKRPCDDFYEHVCDGWIIKNTHTVQVEQHRRFQEDVIKTIQNVTWTGGVQTAIQKAALFYHTCETVVTHNKTEMESLKKMLAETELQWPDLRRDHINLLNITFYISATWHFGTLICIDAHKVEDGALVLTISPSPYFTEIMAIQNLLKSSQFEHLFNRLRDQFASNLTSATTFQEFDLIEKKLKPYLEKVVTNHDVTWWNSYNITNIAHYDWKKMILTYYNETATKIVITNTRFFLAIFDSHSPFQTPEGVLFFGWYIVLLGSYFVDGSFVNFIYGDQILAAEHRSQFCFSISELLMGNALISTFVTELFTASSRNASLPLLKTIRMAYDQIISDNGRFKYKFNAPTYVDGTGRVLDFITKSDPDFVENSFRLYGNMTTSFVQNWKSANRGFLRAKRTDVTTISHQFSKMKSPYEVIHEESDFRLHPQVASALSPKELDAPLGLMLGVLGSVISLALGEILLESKNEWDQDMWSEIQKQAKCVLGKNTSLEDLDAIETELLTRVLSLQALLVSFNSAEKVPDVMIDNFPYLSGVQLLFMVWCFGQCGEVLGREMCNKPLMEVTLFSKSFDCPLGSTMQKQKPCLT
ncbi:unnamed protein product, partial [Ixodes pacificus]